MLWLMKNDEIVDIQQCRTEMAQHS